MKNSFNSYKKLPKFNEILMNMSKEEIKNSFSSSLSFGTSGIRGIMGIGTNRMNEINVVKVIAGTSLYLKSINKNNVLICYDTRDNSKTFAKTAYYVFKQFGINAKMFKRYEPTPVLSYAIKSEGFDLGVNVTASHNPSNYNGLKIVSNIGSQIDEKTSKKISNFMKQVDEFEIYKNLKKVKINYISNSVINNYLKFCLDNVESYSKPNIKVLYTPLNGTGKDYVSKLLKTRKYKFNLVENQKNPDPKFTTCPEPNPELNVAFNEAIKKQRGEDIIIATDPDGDRLGAMCKHNGSYVLLTGNEIGKLLTYFLLNFKKVQGEKFITTTVVTSRAINKLAEIYNVPYFETLTGFKNISAKVEEQSEKMTSLIFFEESCGYEVTGKLRDKDGITAGLLLTEIANYFSYQNKTLIDVLDDINNLTGNMLEESKSYYLPNNKMLEILEGLRNDKIKGLKILDKVDFLESRKTKLPKSNFIKLILKQGEVIIRPSGTEPKLKVYAFACGKEKKKAEEKISKIFELVENKILK